MMLRPLIGGGGAIVCDYTVNGSDRETGQAVQLAQLPMDVVRLYHTGENVVPSVAS